MKLKNLLLILSIIGFSNYSYSSGVPTVDIATITQLQKEAFENASRWTETAKHFKDDLKAQMDTLASQTGIRDIASLVQESSSYFQDAKELQKWISNPQKILDMGFDSLSGDLKDIYKKYGLNSLCEASEKTKSELDIKSRKNCEGQIVLMTLRQQQANNNLNAINERVEKVNAIAKKMAISKDQKESQDLNNAMSTQLALLQADKLKMDVQLQQEKQQDELLEKQKEDLFKQKLQKNKVRNASWK